MVGEVDTYKELPEYDLYGDFNVNYLKLDNLPTSGNWPAIISALCAKANSLLRPGRCSSPTGHWKSIVTSKRSLRTWNGPFPLEFIEVVFSDGHDVAGESRSP